MSITRNYSTNNDLICQLCDKIITTSAIKCMKCDCFLHTKCFDKAAEIFDVQKNDWRCKNCYYKDSRNFEILTMVNYNECLKDQVKLLTKLVSEQDYINCLQKQKLQEFEASVSIDKNVDVRKIVCM